MSATSYLYGVRFTMDENDLILSLREVSTPRNSPSPVDLKSIQELHVENYYKINWPAQRNDKVDVYAPHSVLFDTIAATLGVYELCTLPPFIDVLASSVLTNLL